MRIWLMAARPRTLPAAIAPVLVGTALALQLDDDFHAGAFIAALLGSILIQVGTNLSNDYSDARRGADAEDRLGPVRVTAGGLVPPKQVLMATYITFGLAALCGVYLVSVAGIELLFVGIASIAAGVLYTGGPKPYGYEGLGEVFVFLFFGIVAVAGSTFAQTRPGPGRRSCWPCRSGCWRPRSSSSTTSATWTPTSAPASARSRSGSVASAVARCTRAMVYGSYLIAPLPWLLGAAVAVAAAVLADAAAGGRDRAQRAPAHRRPDAQRGARADRHAAARLLPAAERRHPRELTAAARVRVAIEQRTLRLRTPLATSYGPPLSYARSCSSSSSRAPTGSRAAASARRSSPTTASRTSARAAPWRPTGRVLEGGDELDGGELLDACRAADELPQALAAVDMALWDRAGRRAGLPVVGAARRGLAATGHGQRDDRRRGSRRGVAERARRPRGRVRTA